MRVETELIHRSLRTESDSDDNKKSGIKAEWKTWKTLFSKKYRDRTMIGLLVMVFQRSSLPPSLSPSPFRLPLSSYSHNICFVVNRMEWYQRFIILRPNHSWKYRIRRGYGYFGCFGWDKCCSVFGGFAFYCAY